MYYKKLTMKTSQSQLPSKTQRVSTCTYTAVVEMKAYNCNNDYHETGDDKMMTNLESDEVMITVTLTFDQLNPKTKEAFKFNRCNYRMKFEDSGTKGTAFIEQKPFHIQGQCDLTYWHKTLGCFNSITQFESMGQMVLKLLNGYHFHIQAHCDLDL